MERFGSIFLLLVSDPVFAFRFDASGSILLLGSLVLAAYYGTVWWRYGRNPARGTMAGQSQAPSGISPADARYIVRGRIDSKSVTATIMALLESGALALSSTERGYVVRRVSKFEERLLPTDRAWLEAFPSKMDVELHRCDDLLVVAARRLREAIENRTRKLVFKDNSNFTVSGSVLALVSVIVAAAVARGEYTITLIVGGLFVAIIGVLVSAGRRAFKTGSISRRTVLSLLVIGVFFGVFFSATRGVIVSLPDHWFLELVLLAGLVVLFDWLLEARSIQGQLIVDQLIGLEHHWKSITRAGDDANESEVAVAALPEELRPYAVALDLETAPISGLIDAVNVDDSRTPHPVSRSKGFAPLSSTANLNFLTEHTGLLSDSAVSGSAELLAKRPRDSGYR